MAEKLKIILINLKNSRCKTKITKDWFEQDYGTILNSDRNWFTFDTKRVEVLW